MLLVTAEVASALSPAEHAQLEADQAATFDLRKRARKVVEAEIAAYELTGGKRWLNATTLRTQIDSPGVGIYTDQAGKDREMQESGLVIGGKDMVGLRPVRPTAMRRVRCADRGRDWSAAGISSR